MKHLILILSLFSSSAFASTYTPGLLLRKLQSRQAVIGALQEIQQVVGASGTCTGLELDTMKEIEDSATFTASATCIDEKGEVSESVRINAVIYDPNGEALIQSLFFDFAG